MGVSNSIRFFPLSLLLSLVIRATTASCPDLATGDLIQTGIVSFASLNNNYYTCTDIAISYTIPANGLKFALSMTIYVATTGKFEMDYILNGRQKNGANKLTIILLTASVWTNVGISYVVASRNDVFMGSVIVDTAASFDCSIPGATLIASSTMVAGWAVTATPFKTFTFISGLKTATAPNFLNSSSILDPATGILSLSVIFKETASVYLVKISYMIILYGTFAVSLSNEHSSKGYYNILINSLSVLGKIIVQTIEISSNWYKCTGDNCVSPCLSLADCNTQNGFIIGRTCAICQFGYIWNTNINACICMNNFYPSTTGNGCVLCMTNSIVNVNKNGCTCIAGYTMINNACQPTNSLCTKDSFYNITTHQCQCLNPDQNYLYNQGCSCPTNSIPSSDGNKCVCDENSIWNCPTGNCNICTQCWPFSAPDAIQTKCVCIANYYASSVSICSQIPKCATGTVFNITTQTCLAIVTIKDPVCPPGTSYQSAQGKCICDNPMQILRSNGCACPTNSIPDGPTKCICDNKSISICANGSCDKCSQCWVNSSPINNKCVCNTGYTQSSSFTCTAFVTTQCVIGASYDTITGKCLCNIVSQIITSTGCVCPIMMTLNSANMCVCDTKDGYSLSPNGGGCVLTSSLVVCGKNTEFVNGVCQCNSLSVPINKICTICWANSTPGSHNSVCNCNYGYYADTSTSCAKIPACTPDSMFNVTTKMCTCQIPAKIYKPTGCLCPSGMTLSPSNTCVCNTNSGYFMINGVCVKNNSSGPLQLTTLTGVITNGKSVNGNIRSIGGG